MNIVDIVIIILICLGASLGFKRGFTRELVSTVGFIVILILSFLLKNVVASFLFDVLPFFKFSGIIKGVTVVNILLYEVIAFLVVLAVLSIMLKILMVVTSIFETILNMTIILGIPSKILGALLGAVKWVIISFIVLYVLTLPIFNFNLFNESQICNKVLTKTPILSNVIKDSVEVTKEFGSLKDKYKTSKDTNSFNLEALDLFLKYRVTDIKNVDKLINNGKLKINDADEILNKYRGR